MAWTSVGSCIGGGPLGWAGAGDGNPWRAPHTTCTVTHDPSSIARSHSLSSPVLSGVVCWRLGRRGVHERAQRSGACTLGQGFKGLGGLIHGYMPNLTIRLSDEDMATLDRLATQWGLTRSDVVRKLIRDFDRAVREVREEACRTCARLAAAYLFESMLLNPMVVYHIINANRDLVGDREFIVGWVVTSNHRVFFSHSDDLGRHLLRVAKDYVKKYYGEEADSGVGGRQTTEKPKVQTKPPTPKPPAGGPCHKVVVVYPNGETRDVAEELYRGCKGEETIEISPEDYERYMRGETTLDELIRRYRGTRPATNTAAGGGSNTQPQPQPGTQPQQSNQTDLRGLPYLTLGEVAVRLGLLKLPNNNRDRGPEVMHSA